VVVGAGIAGLTARSNGYPAPIVDHGSERAEALRRYQEI
jgi:deoxyribodipyrimidine photolyase